MIAAVGQIDSGANYWTVSSSVRSRSVDGKVLEDRWIPGGDQQEEGYGRLGMGSGITEGEQAQVESLKARDREVRQHEQTHAALLGTYAIGVPTYYYQMGPDGRAYAVGGSLKVDMGSTGSAGGDSIKAQKIRTAASGVSDMSGADMAVAASVDKGMSLSLQA